LMVQKGKPQLFKLTEDLAESRDASARNTERVQTMLAKLERWKKDVATYATPQPQTLEAVK